jgi:hypothetical protein
MLTTLLLTCVYASSLFGSDKLKIEINTNVELLGLGYFIGFEGDGIESKTVEVGGKQVSKKDWQNYGFMLYAKYKTYAASENLAQSFSVAEHLWLDYLIAFLVQVDNAPNARLTDNIDQSYYINFSKKKDIEEARKNAKLFLEGLNGFYREVNFGQYMTDSKLYYDKAIEEVKKALPNQDFITLMEKFYKKKFDNYALIPSLTIPKSMGFGINYTLNKKTNIFNVFSAFDFQVFKDTNNLDMGFNNPERLRELSVHEFGHSFVNPVVGKLPDSVFKKTEKFFEPLKSRMAEQGYNTWKVCLYEHFVRAGEIFIAEKMGNKAEVEKLKSWYETDRQFKYIPLILPELAKFEKGKNKTYFEVVQNVMDRLTQDASGDLN